MRALMPWRPFRELTTLHNEMDDLFSRFFGEEERWPMRFGDRECLPVIETFTRGEEFVVRADLPGIDPKNVELAVEGSRLTIKGERKVVNEEKKTGHLYREVRYGAFERTVELPEGVAADSVKAAYHDGVLEVTMKAPKGIAPKKVPITIH